jgi:hypothetical protein
MTIPILIHSALERTLDVLICPIIRLETHHGHGQGSYMMGTILP